MSEQVDPAFATAAQFDDPAELAVWIVTAPQQADQGGDQGNRDQYGIPETVTIAYVFENNNANTWVTVKSTIRNFLTGIWKRGGLAGASPDDAFSVFVGLGETMTPEDILEGILRVTVLVAITRPAEFIEITFQQQMQQS